MKRCPDCSQEKPLEAFPPASARPDGRGLYCKVCMTVRSRASYRKGAAAKGHAVREKESLSEGMKRCPDCQEVLGLASFPQNKRSRDGYGSYCKPCHNARGRESTQRLHGSTREYHLRRRYGITSADYDRLVAEQGGLCALCRERAPEHVDHDHLTGAVRGVLCSCCNQGLGNFRDDAATVRVAADYLERTTWQRHQECTGVYRLTSPRPAVRRSSSSSALRHLISSRRAGPCPPG